MHKIILYQMMLLSPKYHFWYKLINMKKTTDILP